MLLNEIVLNIFRNFIPHETGRDVRGIFLNISKAFDKVWRRQGLPLKLKYNGTSENLIKS